MIVFGEVGAGKSSLVNLLAGSDVAENSNSADGCTLKSTGYDIHMPQGPNTRIWDTWGLKEGLAGAVNTPEAINNIYKLTRDLEDLGVRVVKQHVRVLFGFQSLIMGACFKGYVSTQVRILRT